MQRTQFDWQHDYLLTPSEYPISANENHSTYDQFIQLRDTLIFSGKYYNWKKGSKLVVWESEETIEVLWKNWLKLSFEPNIQSATTVVQHAWTYVEYTPTEWDFSTWKFLAKHNYTLNKWLQDFWLISCRILQDWNYRIEYKIQVWSDASPIPAWTTKIYAFVIRYKYLDSLTTPWDVSVAPAKDVDPDNQNGNRFHIAVWDLQQPAWGVVLTWTINGTCDWEWWWHVTGSCSVPLTLANLYTKITAVWFNEADLNANDVLAFHVVDQNLNSLDPYLQASSNFFSVKFTDFTLYN